MSKGKNAKFFATVKQHGKVVARTRENLTTEEAARAQAEANAKRNGAPSGYAQLLIWRNGMLIVDEVIVL